VRRAWITALVIAIAGSVAAGPAASHERDAVLAEVGFDQHLGATLPLDLMLRDEAGRGVRLGSLLGSMPLILTLNEFACRHLCPLVLEGLAAGLRDTGLAPGADYVVITASIDPRETAALARTRKQAILAGYVSPAARGAWHFLTGDETTIRRLADAVGFRYAYDRDSDQYAHPTGVTVITPEGRMARYLFGMDFTPRDLRLALVEASHRRIGSLTDAALLTCYRYDATTGRYTPMVMTAVRASAALTALGLGALIALLVRAERRRDCGPRRDVNETGRGSLAP